MREMKEGIFIAVLHRQRVHQHFKTVHFECEITLDNYRNLFTLFDNSLYDVLKVSKYSDSKYLGGGLRLLEALDIDLY